MVAGSTLDPDQVEHLDLSLTNVCNFKCRYCYPGNSTKLFKERDTLIKEDHDFFAPILGYCNRVVEIDPDEVIHLVTKLKNLKTIEIKGGEPLRYKNHVKLLEKLISTGRSKTIRLNYVTNGSLYSREASLLWKEFKKVTLSFSIDGLEKIFSYTRGASVSFNECVWPNFMKYYADGIASCHVHITISVYNILYLPYFLKWLEDKKLNFSISFGVILRPAHLGFYLLGKSSILGVASELMNSSYKEAHHFTKSLQEYSFPEGAFKDKLLKTFWRASDRVDQLRGVSLKEQLPEVWQGLKAQQRR